MNEAALNSFLTKLGNNIKSLRLKQRLTLEELSAKCDVSESKICNIENGKINCAIFTIAKIAYGLGVEVKKLYEFN